MKNRILILTLILSFLYFEPAIAHKTNAIYNFGREVNASGSAVFAIEEDSRGFIYFGSTREVFIFNGNTWNSIKIPSLGDIRSIKYDSISNRIYLGGFGNFGYLVPSQSEIFEYKDLTHQIETPKELKEIWQIRIDKDSVLFLTHQGEFIFKNEQLTFRSGNEKYFYQAGQLEYKSEINGSLSIIEGSIEKEIWDQNEIKKDLAYQVLELNSNENLILYSAAGAFIHNVKKNEIAPYSFPLDELIKKYWLYTAEKISDSLIAFLTWENGLFITDLEGNILDSINHFTGLPTSYIFDINYSFNNRLWISHEYGISIVDLKKLNEKERFLKKPDSGIQLVSLKTDIDPIIYLDVAQKSLLIEKPNTSLMVEFSDPSSTFKPEVFYEYRFDSLSPWKTIHTDKKISIQNLENGFYHLEIRRYNNDFGKADFLIDVAIPWYAKLTSPFSYVLSGLVFAIIIFSFIHKQNQNQRNRLQRLVDEKTIELKKKQIELESLNQDLKLTNFELDSFLYRSSHDLVAPVKSIRGLLQIIKISKKDQDKYLDLMENRILKLEGLLLEINSYVKNSKSETLKEYFNIYDLVNNIWAEIEFMDNAQKIKFKNFIDPQLSIQSDKEKWKMILRNLISNAVKYHDLKKVDPYVHISYEQDNEKSIFKIEDNGEGMSNEIKPKIFDMFFRANEKSTGSGLGLFLVKKMSELIQTKIELTSTYAQGTTFAIIGNFKYKIDNAKKSPTESISS